MPTGHVERALAERPETVGAALLELPEDQWFDRKSTRIDPRELANHLVAMANADGGTLVVGLASDRVEGTDGAPTRRNGQMQAHIDFCVPPVRAHLRLVDCVNSRGSADHLLVFEVSPSDMVHANQRDEVYLRVGDSSRRLTFQQRQELTYDKGQASYEGRPLPGTSLDLVNQELLQNYAATLDAPDAERLMRARGLLTDDGELTIAGCLLFGQFPQAQLPETYVRVLRYRGTERGAGASQQLLRDTRIEGPIPHQLLEARKAIVELQPVRRALTGSGRFEDVSLIPEDAWLEGLVNAVVHRSYSLAGDHIRIEIFDDRMEISSPGRFPGLVSLDDPLRATRFARNPRIARVAADLQFGQELGEGIRRMFEEMRAAGFVDPVYRQGSGSVQLTLSTEPADRALEARLPRQSRRIISALREADRLSTGEVAEVIDMSKPATQTRLRALQEEGLIEWVGKSPKDPRAYWTLRRGEVAADEDF
jgi:ATP-dependent DNA helicase RecG